MAKFCNQCGRQLNDGEVCNCQSVGSNPTYQQSAPQQQTQPNFQQNFQQNYQSASQNDFGNKIKNMFMNILPMLKNPVGVLKELGDSGDAITGVMMIGLNLIITLFLLIFSCIAIRIKVGDYARFINIPYAQIILGGFFSTAVNYFASAGILFGFTKAFSKGTNVKFSQILSPIGGKALYDIAIVIVAALFMLFSPMFGLFLIAAGFAFTCSLFIVSYCESVGISANGKMYAIGITAVCMIIVSIILSVILGDSLLNSGLIKNIF